MRRFFTIVAAMALAITVLHAQEPNIYASGLSANTVDNTNQEVQISYTLNAPASSLTIAWRVPTNRLKRVLFPTLGRPTTPSFIRILLFLVLSLQCF